MFEGWKDEEAAEKELLQIFQSADKEAKKRLFAIFVKAFKKRYDLVKEEVTRLAGQEYFSLVEYFKQERDATIFDNIAHLRNTDSLETQAAVLGNGLGIILAAIEYGLTNEKINLTIGDELKISDHMHVISNYLKELNKHVNWKFIKYRIEQIAKKNAAKLSRKRQLFIVKIALLFR